MLKIPLSGNKTKTMGGWAGQHKAKPAKIEGEFSTSEKNISLAKLEFHVHSPVVFLCHLCLKSTEISHFRPPSDIEQFELACAFLTTAATQVQHACAA